MDSLGLIFKIEEFGAEINSSRKIPIEMKSNCKNRQNLTFRPKNWLFNWFPNANTTYLYNQILLIKIFK